MHGEIGRARETVQVLVLVAVAFTGCGQKIAGGSSDAGVANPDSSQAADARADFSGDTLVANPDGTLTQLPHGECRQGAILGLWRARSPMILRGDFREARNSHES
jgi:hypothetical protein